MSDTPSGPSQRRSGFIAGAAIAQSLMVPYLVLAGLMAAEVSGALSAALLLYGLTLAVATVFLFRHKRWAWRLSSALAVVAFLAGAGVAWMPPSWVGGIHALGAAAILGALFAGRPAIPAPPALAAG
ncbi:hypothetical protein [Myxococcus sp. AB056]|uniref:hypothetical protein n=1 Tax=Myxococcus sp. AB056 TaxID=2562792 RepID=UPI001E2D401E|nr:hypothetical protein [Myxococcus sp. AB056]